MAPGAVTLPHLPARARNRVEAVSTCTLRVIGASEVLNTNSTSPPVVGSNREIASKPGFSSRARNNWRPRVSAGVEVRSFASSAIWRYSGWPGVKLAVAVVAFVPTSLLSLYDATCDANMSSRAS